MIKKLNLTAPVASAGTSDQHPERDFMRTLMKMKALPCFAALIAVGGFLSISAQAATVYTESFVGALQGDSELVQDYGGFTAFRNDGTDQSALGADPMRVNVANDNDYVFIGSAAANQGDSYALISGAGTINPNAYFNDLAFDFTSDSTDANPSNPEMGWRFLATVGSTIYASDFFSFDQGAPTNKMVTVSDSVWNVWTGETDLTDGFDISNISSTAGTLAAGNISDIGVLAIDGAAGNDRMRFRDFTISGTAVPEPGSLALLGLGSLGMIVRRRRK